MTTGARNVHALAGALRRLEREAAEGPCALHPSRPAVGFISGSLGVTPKGCCEACAQYAVVNGYTVHRPFDPFALEDDCDVDD